MGKKVSVIGGGVVLFFIILFSCKVGLGSAIDTYPPSITISQPEVNSVIRDKFCMMGTCSDDGDIKSVQILMDRIAEKSSAYPTIKYNAVVNQPEGKWSCIIDPLPTSENPVPDGTYEFTVVITDTYERQTSVKRTLTIDNTAPIIVLQRPGSRHDALSGSIDTYGTELWLVGQSADDNDVKLFEMDVYKDAGFTTPIDPIDYTVKLENVPPNIRLKFAEKNAQDASGNPSAEAYLYDKIYGNSFNSTPENRYFTIRAYDSAQRYPEDGTPQSNADKKGNCTSEYYLYDEISTSVLKANTIVDIYSITNGTKTDINDVLSILDGKELTKGSFIVYPTSAPTYSVSGRNTMNTNGAGATLDTCEDIQLLVDSSYMINLKRGLDDTPFKDTSTFEFYLQECTWNWDSVNSKWTYTDGTIRINPTSKDILLSGGNYQVNLKFKAQTDQMSKLYRLVVNAKDQNGNNVISETGDYGVKFITNGAAPSLTVEKPVSGVNYIKLGSDLILKGSSTAATGRPTVSYELKNSSNVLKASESNIGTNKNEFDKEFDISIPKEKFNQLTSDTYNLTVKSSLNDKETIVERTIFYDVAGPEARIESLLPSADKYAIIDAVTEANEAGISVPDYLNGIVTLKVSISDNEDVVYSTTDISDGKCAWFEILDDQSAQIDVNYALSQADANSGNWTTAKKIPITTPSKQTFYIDTTSLASTGIKQVTIKLHGYDRAGNENNETNDSAMTFTVDQSSDLPVILPSVADKFTFTLQSKADVSDSIKNPTRKNTISLGESVLFKLFDDDGLSKIEVRRKAVDNNNIATTDNNTGLPAGFVTFGEEVETLNLGKATSYVYTLNPTGSDYYKYVFKVTDINGKVNYVGPFDIYIKAAAPVITASSTPEYISAAQTNVLPPALKFTNTISINSSKEAPFYVFRKVAGTSWTMGEDISAYADKDQYVGTIEKNSQELYSFVDNDSSAHPLNPQTTTKYVYVVKDCNNSLSNEVEILCKVDNTQPNGLITALPGADDTLANMKKFSFQGTASDDSSGVKEVQLTVTDFSSGSAGVSKTVKATGTNDWVYALTYKDTAISDDISNNSPKLSWNDIFATEGKKQVSIRVIDVANNYFNSTPQEFWYDTAVPIITVDNLEENKVYYYRNTSSNKYTLTGSITENGGIEEFKVTYNSNSYPITINPDKTWSIEVEPASASTTELKIKIKDKSGREDEKTYKICNDINAPSLDITNPDGDISGDKSLNGSTYTFRFSVQDSDSGIEDFKYLFTDTPIFTPTGYDVTLTTDEENQIITSAKAGGNGWVQSTSKDGATIKYNLASGKAPASPASGTIYEGEHYIYAYAIDKTGNESVKLRRYWVDKDAPILKETNIGSSGITISANPGKVKFIGTVKDVNEIDALYIEDENGTKLWNANLTNLGACTTETSWSTEATPVEIICGTGQNQLSDGEHTLKIIAKDKAQKETILSKIVTVDTKKPVFGTYSVTTTANYTDASSNKWFKSPTVGISVIDVEDIPQTTGGWSSGISSVQYTTDSGDSASCSWITMTKQGNTAKATWTANVYCANQGLNTIRVKIIDNAGNEETTNLSQNVYIDSTMPDTATIVSIDGETTVLDSKLTNGRENIKVMMNVSDSGSGVKEIIYKGVTDETKTYSGTNPFEFEISAAKVKKGNAVFQIVDNVGNKYEWSPFSITLDESAPKVTIDTPKDADTSTTATGIQVNGILTFEGSLKDSGGSDIKAIDICYYINSTDGWKNLAHYDSSNSTDLSNWSTEINTATAFGTLSENQEVTICVIATDSAGNRSLDVSKVDKTISDPNNSNNRIPNVTPDNIAAANKCVVKVAQDSDRPIIKFSNISGTSAPYSLKNGIIFGSVSDDDGINKLEYKNAGDSTWKNVTLNGNSFEIALDDGPYDLNFRVTDSGNIGGGVLTGNVFETNTANLPKIYIKETPLDNSTNMVLNMIADQKNPEMKNIYYSGYDGSTYLPYNSDYTSFKYGGTHNKLKIKFDASDDNGIVSATVTVNNNTPIFATCNDVSHNDKNYHTWEVEDVLLGSNSGAVNIAIEITDGAGLTKTEKIMINVDNDAPNVSFSSPDSSKDLSGEQTAYGGLSELCTMWYAISTDGTNAPSTNGGNTNTKWSGKDGETATPKTDIALISNYTVEYKPITNPGLNWYIYFDGNTTATDSKTHSNLLKNWLETCKITTADALTNNQFKDIVTLYLWVKAEDEVGNITESCTPLHVDPQGDRPRVTIDYPDAGSSIGGTIRLSGSTEDNTGVDSVWVQVISVNHEKDKTTSTWGSFTKDGSNNVTAFSLDVNDLNYMKNYTATGINTVGLISKASESTAWTGSAASGKSLDDYGIKANLSGSSWNLKINTNSEFNLPNGTNDVAICVYAVDLDGNKSFTSKKYFKIDTSSPQITYQMFKQYSESTTASQILAGTATPIAEQTYSAGMFLKGNWFLILNAEDDGSINSIKVYDKITKSEDNMNTSYYKKDTNGKVTIAYPLNTSTGTGSINLEVRVEDDNTPNANMTPYAIEVGYDNLAPKLRRQGTTGYNINPNIKQSSGFYTLSSQVDESVTGATPSGLKAVVFYFVRRNSVSNTVTVLDPMQIRTGAVDIKSATQLTDTNTSNVVYDSGLYWLKRNVNVDQNANNVFTYTSTEATQEQSIHNGGLVQIKGILYTITNVTGTSITVDKEIPSDTTNVCFALGMVVDTAVENVKDETKLADGYYKTFAAGDNDRMYESIGGTTAQPTWEAQIVSKNIPDGPIELHYVAFDNAGNSGIGIVGNVPWNTFKSNTGLYNTADVNAVKSETLDGTNTFIPFAYSYDENNKTYVSNNAPRIVSVTVKTDYNGNGSFAENGESTTLYYSSIINNGIEKANKVTNFFIASGNKSGTGEGIFTLKDKSIFEPEIIGGNGDIAYDINISDVTNSGGTLTSHYVAPESINSWTQKKFGVALTGNSDAYDEGTDSLSDITTQKREISMEVSDFISHENSTIEKPTWFTFRLWDSTEGTTQFVNSQNAILQVAVANQVNDNAKPNVVINPFHWVSKSDNSVYWKEGKAQGHIEFEDDLSSQVVALYGDDPKVSGTIIIDGWVYDNIRLSEINVTFPGHSKIDSSTLAATYGSSGWVSKALLTNLGTNGWAFEIDDKSADSFIGANGQKVMWKLYIDTAKISGVTALNKVFTITAKDKRGIVSGVASGLTSSGSKNGSESDGYVVYNNPTYQMDVVPYITSIQTTDRQNSGLKDNNIRSASGKYSVISGNTSNFITINGFNLNPPTESEGIRIIKTSDVVKTVSDSSGSALAYSGKTGTSQVFVENASTVSGYLEFIDANNIRALNNINNNDSVAGYTKKDNKVDDYAEMPNRACEADYVKTKNIQLTDDRYIRFFDMKDTGVKNGYYPVMIMEGDDPVFGYIDKNGGGSGTPTRTGEDNASGNYQTVGAMQQRSKFSGTETKTNRISKKIYTEYLAKAITSDQMGMARDSDGRFYNVSVYNMSGGVMNIVYDKYAELYSDGKGWVGGTGYSGYDGNWSYSLGNNAITLETVDYGGTLGTERYISPKLITKGGSINGDAKVYMSYFDDVTGEICFRNFMLGKDVSSTADYNYEAASSLDYYGQLNGNIIYSLSGFSMDINFTDKYIKINDSYHKLTMKANDQSHYYYTIDGYTESKNVYSYIYEKKNGIYSIMKFSETGVSTKLDSTHKDNGNTVTYNQKINFVENRTKSNSYNNGRLTAVEKGSRYYDIGVTSDEHVVVVYYDESNSKLILKYSAAPVDGSNPTANISWTTSELVFPDYVGSYISLAVDGNALHIAAFDVSESDLIYIYIPTYNTTEKKVKYVKVDQYGSVGNWTQIKVKNGVPYIGYTNASENGQKDAIKMAYCNSTISSSNIPVGVDDNGYTTGDWEYMTVPAISAPQGGDSKFQNVCLDFDSKGIPVIGYLGTDLEFGKWFEE